MTGKLRLTVDKDRPGHVRAVSAEAKRVGIAILESDSATGAVAVRIEPADSTTPAQRKQGRRSMLAEAICGHLAAGGSDTLKGVRAGVRGNNGEVDTALEWLVQRGYVGRATDARGGYHHTLLRVYTVADDLADDGYPQTVPTVPDRAQTDMGTVDETADTVPVPGPPPKEGPDGARSDVAAQQAANQKQRRARFAGMWVDPQTGEVLDDDGSPR